MKDQKQIRTLTSAIAIMRNDDRDYDAALGMWHKLARDIFYNTPLYEAMKAEVQNEAEAHLMSLVYYGAGNTYPYNYNVIPDDAELETLYDIYVVARVA